MRTDWAQPGPVDPAHDRVRLAGEGAEHRGVRPAWDRIGGPRRDDHRGLGAAAPARPAARRPGRPRSGGFVIEPLGAARLAILWWERIDLPFGRSGGSPGRGRAAVPAGRCSARCAGSPRSPRAPARERSGRPGPTVGRAARGGSARPTTSRTTTTSGAGPVRGRPGLFERLTLEAFQSGLSWITILRKRPAFRVAFDGFDPARGRRRTTTDDVERLMADAGIVRNRAKILATIANAQAALALPAGLARSLWSYAPDAGPRRRRTGADVPAVTPESVALAQGLARARLQVRRADHRVRAHAGGRHGRRPPGRLHSPAR